MAENNKILEDQYSRFIKAARALECDDDKERFESALGKIAAQKPLKAARKSKPKAKAKKTK